jgi:hypothetical protein
MIGDVKLEKLTIVRLGAVMSYSTLHELGDRIMASFHGIIQDYQLSHHEAPVAGSLDAFMLTMILGSEYGGHTHRGQESPQ